MATTKSAAAAAPAPESTEPTPTPAGAAIGDTVLYLMEDGFEVRPAIVVRLWGGGYVSLHVFLDGRNDGAPIDGGMQWISSVQRDDDGAAPRSWRPKP